MNQNIVGYKKIFFLENILRNYCSDYISVGDLDKNFLSTLVSMSNTRGTDSKNIEILLTYSHLGQLFDLIKSKNFKNYKSNTIENVDISNLINVRNDIMHSRNISDDELKLIDDKCLTVVKNLEDRKYLLQWNEFVTKQIDNYNITMPHIVYPLGKNFKYLVGRDKELKELLTMIEYPIPVSIVGHGGLGKTALVQQLIEDLIADPESKFENIYLMSFKNTAFEKGKISRFEKSISNHKDLVHKLANFMNINPSDDFEILEARVWETMFETKSLLILDNLETEVVKSNLQEFTDIAQKFINNYTKPSRLIITSRYGLGDREAKLSLKQFDLENTKKLLSENLSSNKAYIKIHEEDYKWAQNYTHGNPGLILSLTHTLNSSAKNFKDLRIEYDTVYTSESRQLHDQYEEFLNFCFEHTIESMKEESQQFLAAICYICSQTNLSEINEEFLSYLRDELDFISLGENNVTSNIFTNIGFLQRVPFTDRYFVNKLFINFLDGTYSDKVYNVFDLEKSNWIKRLNKLIDFINHSQIENEKPINSLLAELYKSKFQITKATRYLIMSFFCDPTIKKLNEIYMSFENFAEVREKINLLDKIESQLKNNKFVYDQQTILYTLVNSLFELNKKIMSHQITAIRQSEIKKSYYLVENKIPLLQTNKMNPKTANIACKLLVYFKDYRKVEIITENRPDLIKNLFLMHSKQVGDLAGIDKKRCFQSIIKCESILKTDPNKIYDYEKAQFYLYSTRYYKTEDPAIAIRNAAFYETYYLSLLNPKPNHIFFYLESLLNRVEGYLNNLQDSSSTSVITDNIQHLLSNFSRTLEDTKKLEGIKQDRLNKIIDTSKKIEKRFKLIHT